MCHTGNASRIFIIIIIIITVNVSSILPVVVAMKPADYVLLVPLKSNIMSLGKVYEDHTANTRVFKTYLIITQIRFRVK